VIQLWNIILAVSALFLEDFEHVAVLATRVSWVQTGQVAIHRPPENSISYTCLYCTRLLRTAAAAPAFSIQDGINANIKRSTK